MLEEYGTSNHYRRESGRQYFEWQDHHGKSGAKLERRKFEPHIRPNDAVLDFGCGGGHLLDALSCGVKAGVEINPEARATAKSAYNLDVRPSLRTFDAAEFDVVVSNHALEHVPFPIGALREMRRVLQPTGVLLLCVPLDDWRVQRRYRPASDRDHHLHTWTPQQLGNTLLEAGFDVSPSNIKILRHAWPPGYAALAGIHPRLFDAVAACWSVIRRRRQLLALATPADDRQL